MHPICDLFELEKCGLSQADRIFGGIDAAPGTYPWIARVEYISKLVTPESDVQVTSTLSKEHSVSRSRSLFKPAILLSVDIISSQVHPIPIFTKYFHNIRFHMTLPFSV
jgi:hypothetical protein